MRWGKVFFMSDLVKKSGMIAPAGEIVAENVSYNDFIAHYATSEERYEWVEGFVIKMGRSTIVHRLLIKYLELLFDAYLHWNPIGNILNDSIMVRLSSNVTRLPDLFFVLANNPNLLTTTDFHGAPDLCIEIVSQESIARDYVNKLAEYENAGVQEYWIIDPLHQQVTFNRLQANGLYAHIAPDADGNYESPLLPKLKIHIPILWQEKLPDLYAVGETVKAMFEI
jgi:Uma2 family endonuclease